LEEFHHSVQYAKVPGVDSILIIGASGGIGSAAIFLAKQYFEIKNVYAVCSGKNASYCESLGATQVINYQSENYWEKLASQNVDVIVDNIGGLENLKHCKDILKEGGTYATNVPGGQNASLSGVLGFFYKLYVYSNFSSKKAKFCFNGATADGPLLQSIVDWLAGSATKFGIDNIIYFPVRTLVYSLQDGIEGIKNVHSGRSVGKSVISFAQ
jgi:NADPH:quinone reductase-like Zn-dependent oxidoreductase